MFIIVNQHRSTMIFCLCLFFPGRRKSARSVFVGKRFFLDLRTTRVGGAKIRQLVDDVQFLGGVRDNFVG